MRFLSIWFALLFGALSHADVPLEQFFAYGPNNGDQQLPIKYQTSPREYRLGFTHDIALDPPFSIFNESQAFAIVDCEGVISFSSGYINVLRGIVDVERIWEGRNGQTYFRKSNATADLAKARQEIGSAFPDYRNIDLKWTVVATWYQIAPYRVSNDAPNTFQAILTTDGTSSFAIMYYNKIGWTAKFPDARAGFEWKNATTWERYFIRGTESSTIAISTIANRSNVGSPGKWIFQIDQPNIIEANPMCEPFVPQPKHGFCKSQLFEPDSVAQCGCKLGYKSDTMESLKCSRLTNNRTVGWTGKVPKCCPTQAPLTPCDCHSSNDFYSSIDHRLMKTAYEFTMINDTKLALSKRRQRVAKRQCINSIAKCLIDINDVCDALRESADCINRTRRHYEHGEHEPIFHLKIPELWHNNNACQKALDIVNNEQESLEQKVCPPVPAFEHGRCGSLEKKPYLSGSVVQCYCLPDYMPANTMYNSERECSRDEDGNLYWSGSTPVCKLQQ